MDIGTDNAGGSACKIDIIISSNENAPTVDVFPADCWRYEVFIDGADADGRRLYREVGGSESLRAQMAGPGEQATWTTRIIQKVDEATKKIQCWDGPDDASLEERLTANDTANSEADNVYVGMFAWIGNTATTYFTVDNFTLVTS